MKNLLSITIVAILAAVLLVASKPTDTECIAQIRQHLGAGNITEALVSDVLINRYTLTVEDHIFYKQVYTITGDRVGTGIFGTVIFN